MIEQASQPIPDRHFSELFVQVAEFDVLPAQRAEQVLLLSNRSQVRDRPICCFDDKVKVRKWLNNIIEGALNKKFREMAIRDGLTRLFNLARDDD